VSVKSSPGGPLIYRSARVFTPFGGSAREPISWQETDTSFSKDRASALLQLNTKIGGLKSFSIHASMWEKRQM
jgi:hypothetical protein